MPAMHTPFHTIQPPATDVTHQQTRRRQSIAPVVFALCSMQSERSGVSEVVLRTEQPTINRHYYLLFLNV